jgi:hypothetical protein
VLKCRSFDFNRLKSRPVPSCAPLLYSDIIANAQRLKKKLEKAEERRKQHGARFEESNYALIHLTSSGHKAAKAAITINGIKITRSQEATYLGIILDK